MRILTDADVDRLPLAPLIAAVRTQIIADARGEAVAPPRHFVDFADGSLVFTIGGDKRLAGFRAYQTFAKPGHAQDDQIIAAWDQQTGEMLGLAIGNKLGALRTGIIGAIAADVLAPRNARILTIVGTGRQAETQLLAISTVRAFDEVRVVGRRRETTATFAERLAVRLGRTIASSTDARAALDGADAVVLATTAEQPVIEADWLEPHAYVASIGPKSRDAHELPLELADRAGIIATDSPQQIARMGDSHMLFGQPAYDRIQHLGELAADGEPVVAGPALFLSIGLAGTEVACLAAALEHLPA
jgi:ornithine cyclodeaminase/alanine dehydrogenase-like protein (mu-crystallin family)